MNSAGKKDMVASNDIMKLLSVKQQKEEMVTLMFLAQSLNIIMVGPLGDQESKMRADLGIWEMYVERIL